MAETYPYQPVNLPNETRVLTLYPGARDDDVICSLSHMSLDADEQYEALSYCWSKSVSHPLAVREEELPEEYTVSMPGERKFDMDSLLSNHETKHLHVRCGGVLPGGKIKCDGVEMAVGGELLAALKGNRDLTKSIRIWIDALCINQSDLLERNEHVKIMGKVYGNASQVRISLGEPTGIEAPLLAAMMDFKTLYDDIKSELEEADGIEDAQYLFFSHPSWRGIEWAAIAQLLDRAWFERIWVVQELAKAVSPQLIIENQMVPWDLFIQFLEVLNHYKISDIIPNYPAITRVKALMATRESIVEKGFITESEIPDIFGLLRHFKCTDLRDKVYGLLGLLDDNSWIEVDYRKSPEQVFTDLAVRFLKKGRIDILCECFLSSQTSALKLPSWVPDWTQPGWTSSFRFRGLPCSAAGDTSPELIVDREAGHLYIQGRILDTVRVVNDKGRVPLTKFDPEDLRLVDNKEDSERKNKKRLRDERRSTSEALENMTRLAWPFPSSFTSQKLENMWRTFMCNRTRNGEIPEGDHGLAWKIYLKAMFHETNTNEDQDEVEEDESYIESVIPDTPQNRPREMLEASYIKERYFALGGANAKWVYNRRFYISEAERYGWTVDGVLPGDLVVALYGCDYPLIIRPEGEETHRIIGDCYIHGLMDGEGMGDSFEERGFIIV